MKVIVTGGAGFIGSAVIRLLLAGPETTVINVDKLTYAASVATLQPFERHPSYIFEKADVCDADLVAGIFARHQPDAVIHLAAETHVDRSIDSPAVFVETNLIGTYTLLEAARCYLAALEGSARARFRFVHVSTDEVYGSLGPMGRFSETSPYDPSSPYAATKAGSDHLVQAWGRTYAMATIVCHSSNNFGPYQFPEKLIPLMIINGIEGRPLPVYGDGGNVRDWLYVDDHARALVEILHHGRAGETYNVGAGNERNNLDVVRSICAALDRLAPQTWNGPHAELITFVPDRPGHDRRYAIDSAKLVRDLGWGVKETFDSGIERTVEWYLANRDWWQPIRGRRYGGERLGLIARNSDTRHA
jgi:dTDP-glucose 4,6-dehydratase